MNEKEAGQKKPKDKRGRPTDYTTKLAELICERVATHDFGLRMLTKMYDDIPDKATINRWRRKYPEFRAQYAQAKCEQMEFLTEDILDIADDGTNDWMEVYDKEGECLGWRLNGEHVQRSRVRIDTRKWLACKLAPKIYGELSNNSTNPNETFDKIRGLVKSFNDANNSEM